MAVMNTACTPTSAATEICRANEAVTAVRDQAAKLGPQIVHPKPIQPHIKATGIYVVFRV